ncbi:hypothetical protein L798_13104 [Zootermopsis nevadensis]|uniref:Uncharacterized protein n=1 Tax=Zootermopsis nevadensis TaxID=136037 RepID=A0A067R4J5_ZOONE|nr:hypothetical protein L798_13104 [Zootermopsis nevadensis]
MVKHSPLGYYYRLPKRPPLAPILRRVNPIHITTPCSSRSFSNIILIYTPTYLEQTFRFLYTANQLHEFPISLLDVRCSAHHILTYLIILVVILSTLFGCNKRLRTADKQLMK